MTTQNTGEALKTTRRTLVKGAAWSVPVVAMGATAAEAAASLPPVAPDLVNSFGCKWPGGGNPQCNEPLDKGFRIFIPFDNNTGQDVEVHIISQAVTAGGSCSRDFESWERGPGATFVASDGVLQVPTGSQRDYWVTWHDDDSGNNKTMSVTYTYTVTSGPTAGQVFGPYTVPVAKVFNTTCPDMPECSIPAGPCNNTLFSDCP